LGFRLALSDIVLAATLPLITLRAVTDRRTRKGGTLLTRSNLDGHLAALAGVVAMGVVVALLRVGVLSSYVVLNKFGGLLVMVASFYMVLVLLRERPHGALRVFLAAGSLLNLVGLVFYGAWYYGGIASAFVHGHGRFSGLLVDPNAFGGYLVVLLLLQMALLSIRAGREVLVSLIWTVNSGLLGIGLLLTRSRGAWLALVAGGLTLLWSARREIRMRRAVVAVAVLTGGAAIIFAVAGPRLLDILPGVLSPLNVIVRWEQIGSGLEHFVQSPVWGIGLDVSRHLGSRWIIHNTYVWFLAEMGLIGFGALALLLLRVGRNWRGALRSSGPLRAWAVGGTAAWVSMLFLALGIEALYQRHLWLLMALSVVLLEQAMQQRAWPESAVKPHRVLIVTTVAGTVRGFLLPHIDRLRERGFDVEVACNVQSEQKRRVLRARGIEVHHLPLRRRLWSVRNLLGFWRLVRLIRKRGYRVVEVHTPVAAFLGRLAARVADPRIRTIYFAHGFHFHSGRSPLRNLLYILLEKLAGRWTDRLLVINREDEAAAGRYRLVPPDRVRYVPGIGVDMSRYDPDNVSAEEIARARNELRLEDGQPLLVMAAEFNPGKRHRDAIRALALMERQDVHLALAGVGPLVQATRDLAHQLGVSTRVHVLGFRRDLPVLMRASVATILPSQREGLSRTVMESLCLEVPVVGADVRGIRDLVGDDAGILVPVGDVCSLAGAMTWVVEHPNEAREMGRRGRARMAGYDLERVLELRDALYEEIVGTADQTRQT